MELKPGYRQTEVGLVPEEWDVVTATAACSLVVDCKNRTPPVVVDSDYAVVRTPNVRGGQFVLKELRYTDEASYREWTARAVPQFGDVMITREAPLGEVCPVPEGRKVCLGQRMMLYRPSPDKTDSRYLLYSLMSRPVRTNLLKKIGGSTVGHAKVDDIRFLLLPLPPLPEQRAIGAALSDVDALLDGLERLIAKKRDLKQAAMQQLLTGRTCLPGFTSHWESRCVAEMGDVLAGKALNIHGVGGLRPYLRTKNVLDGRIDLEDVLQMPMTEAEFNRFRIDRGDVLLNEGQSIELVGRCSMYRGELVLRCAMQNQLLRFRAHARTSPEFAEHLFRHCQHTGVFAAIATQTTSVAHLGTLRFSDLRLSWPIDLKVQEAIATALSDMDAELSALEARRDKTQALKQAMMQELLTGRTRLV